MISPDFSTAPMSYRGMTYWIHGTPAQGVDGTGEYRYFIKRSPDSDPLMSEQSYPGVIVCNRAARAVIDTLSGVTSNTRIAPAQAWIKPEPESVSPKQTAARKRRKP